MKMTTLVRLAYIALVSIVVFPLQAQSSCPVGVDDVINTYTCTRLNYDLQANIDRGNAIASTFSWTVVSKDDNLEVVGGSGTTPFIQDSLFLLSNFEVGASVVYEVTPTGPEGCTGEVFTLQIEVLPPPSVTGCLACNNTVNVSLKANCRFPVTVDEVVEGDDYADCDNLEVLREALQVVVFDGIYPGGDAANADNVIDRKGTFSYELRLRPEFGDCFVWEACWGNIVAEDKTAPEVICPPDVIGLVKRETTKKEAEAIVDGVPYEYRPGWKADGGCPDTEGCDYTCPPATPGFNYLICTEVDSIYQQAASYEEETYPYFTGFPEVIDCSPYELIDVQDTKIDFTCGERYESGRRVLLQIERTFRYRDEDGNLASCTQHIYFFQPEIRLPDCEVQLDLCDYPDINTANASEQLDPVLTQTAPYYFNALCERIPLTDHQCQITVDYEDEVFPGPEDCGVKVVRRWTFLDWCWSPEDDCDLLRVPEGCSEALGEWTNKEQTYEQVIIVGDDMPPTVTCPELKDYSVGPFICQAIISPPPPVVTGECKDWSWSFELYGDVTDPRTGITTPDQLIAVSNNNHIVTGIAPGVYDLHYLVTDVCGNTGRAVCSVRVVDGVNPVAICNRDLNVSLGGAFTVAEGVARLDAADVDEGSWDNCSLDRLEVRREIDNGCINSYTDAVLGLTFPEDFAIRREAATGFTYYLNGADTLLVEEEGAIFSWWSPSVFFTCCDISESDMDRRRVELRATDAAGNANICWLRVYIEDKLPPSCEVSNARILCTEVDFDPQDVEQVAARFGAAEDIVTVNDNCSAFIEEAVVWETDGCGSGILKREFTVTDGSGRSGSCTQEIVIEEVNRYDIRFPKDLRSAECGVVPSDSLIYASEGCDVLAISRDTVRYEASGDECFKLFVTYNIVNWCEYEGESVTPTIIPRDIDEDGELQEHTWLEAGEDPDFVDTYLPGEPNFFLVKLYGAQDDGSRQDLPERVLVRADCPQRTVHVGYRTWKHRGDGIYTLLCDKDLDNICENELYETQCWTPGLYRYTQVLKVYDNTPPAVKVLSDDFEFCAYGDPVNGCDGRVDVVLSVEDECSILDAELREVELWLYQDANQAVGPGTGLFEVVNSENDYLLTGSLPIGEHTFVVRFTDGCGNVSGQRVDISVIDCKSPAPVCINGVALELMPVDEDGDGVVDGGMNVLTARSLIASSADDCSGEVTYSINLFGEEPNREQTSLTVSCDDPLFETIPVEVWAWDPAGNGDRCETFFIVEDLQNLCSVSGDGDIAGIVVTEEDEPLEEVDVILSGRQSAAVRTQEDGSYLFENLQEGYDYTVTPARDGDYLNGVSTFDLVLISKHILQVKPLDSPYKLIAADVNRSNSVTTLDLIQLRKLILTVDTALQNNTSWRFVPADYIFPDPDNPFGASFPEVLNFNNLAAVMNMGDFIGIKVGDVNLSARPNSLAAAEVRGAAGTFRLETPDQWLQPGREYEIPITTAALKEVAGYQFSLRVDPAAVELKDLQYGVATAEHFGFFPDRGLVTTSWHSGSQLPTADSEELFRLIVVPQEAIHLSEVLTLASRPTTSEAYNSEGALWEVTLDFQHLLESPATPQLLPNRPNPFRTETFLPFELPQAGQVTLSVYDESGRQVYVHQAHYEAGYYEHRLTNDLTPASGVFYYTLEINGHRMTRSMMRID